MSQTLAIGPLALPVPLVLLAASIAAGWWCSERIARRGALAIEPALYVLVAVGLLAARLAFVVEYRAAYADTPLAIVDVRDGGWRPVAGFAAAALGAALLGARRRTGYWKPLAAGWSAAAGAWFAGVLATSALQGPPLELPALTLTSLDGAPVRLASLQGRPVVLNLWASWCPPCRREMPVLQQAQQRHADVQFVFVNQGESAAKVQAFLAGKGLALRNVLLDEKGQTGLELGQRALPTTLFFDARGHLVATRVGELSTATLAERLDALEKVLPSPDGFRGMKQLVSHSLDPGRHDAILALGLTHDDDARVMMPAP